MLESQRVICLACGAGSGKLRAAFKVVRGATGCLSSVWAYVHFFPSYLKTMQKYDPTDQLLMSHSDTYVPVTRPLGLALSLIGDGTSLITGLIRLRRGIPQVAPAPAVEMVVMGEGGAGFPGPVAQPPENIATKGVDTAELVITLLNAGFATLLIGLQIKNMVDANRPEDAHARTVTKLLCARYMFFTLPRLTDWMFTQTWAGNILKNPYAKAAVITSRALGNTAGVALHATAAFRYMDLE